MEKFCQSCGMPLTEEILGTNTDGSKNQEYCHYCFKNGKFVQDGTMEEFIEACIPFMEDMEPDAARKQMQAFFPQLKRWRSDELHPSE